MAQYVLANAVNYLGSVLNPGKTIDSAAYDVVALTAAGAHLLPYNAATAARGAQLQALAAKGQALPLDQGQVVDAVSTYVDPAALGQETDEQVLTAGAGVVLHDMVYVSAADTVGRASATDSTKVAIGMVRALDGASATVRKDGEVTGLSGLTAGLTYYLSTAAGQITSTPLSGSGNIVQKIGVAADATTILLQVDHDYVVVA